MPFRDWRHADGSPWGDKGQLVVHAVMDQAQVHDEGDGAKPRAWWRRHCKHWQDPQREAAGSARQGRCCRCGKEHFYQADGIEGWVHDGLTIQQLLADFAGIDLDTHRQASEPSPASALDNSKINSLALDIRVANKLLRGVCDDLITMQLDGFDLSDAQLESIGGVCEPLVQPMRGPGCRHREGANCSAVMQ